MRGYYRDPEATRQALPGDGWFHTGDLGELVGTALKLVARKDRVFKLQNAEKVVPTEIENRLAGMNKYIRHVIIAGSGRDFLCALIYPDYFRIREEFGHDRERADRIVKESLRDTISEFNRTHEVKFERIHAVALVSKELTIEEQELTPSLKVRVRDVLARAEDYLTAVYEPSAECECRYLRRVLRVEGDDRPCFGGKPQTLDRCHECGNFIFGDDAVSRRPETRPN
jgi:long-chain acyl-CoA synthetase